jgi:hypothetical protein
LDRNQSPTPFTNTGEQTDSDDSIRTHMKLVPQPLFKTKPAAKLPGAITGQFIGTSRSPRDSDRRRSSTRSRISIPLRLSFSDSSSHRRRSTSGSIPISPPTDVMRPQQATVGHRNPASPFKTDRNERASKFYPYVGSRKARQPGKKQPVTRLPTLGHGGSQSSARVVQTTSLQNRRSSTGSDKKKQPLLQRVAKGAAKYADLLTSPAELPEHRAYQPITAATVAPRSPHMLPSPATSPTQTHLGWSDQSKHAFDNVRSSTHSARWSPGQAAIPEYTHVTAPARPLDETRMSLRDPDTPRRKNSIFGGMLDGWKETRAEKRREELKKVIKVVPDMSPTPGSIKRRSSTFGWM